MKLLIYEPTHHETLPAILDLAELYFREIAVFLKELSFENLSASDKVEDRWPRTEFFKQIAGYPNRRFIRDAFNFVRENNYTHLHISTLDNNLLYFARQVFSAPKMPVSLSVQAVNEYCSYRFGNLRDITESAAKLYLHKRIRQYRVFFPLMKEALEKRLPGSEAIFIPSRFYAEKQEVAKTSARELFRIVIPGAVDPNRRDYYYVVSFLKEFLPRYSNEKQIELVILGNSNTEYGKKIIDTLKMLQSDYFKLVYYNQYIPQSEYERQLAQANILWSPIQLQTLGIRKTSEIYGISTATGLTGDLLLNEKPALVPLGFQIPEHYEDALITYSSPGQLAEHINVFIHKIDENIREKIRKSFSFFRKENFKTAFCQLMKIAD